ncbi:hypothetical protein [Paracoccus aminophilus]|uniref:Uncharacterized protein n=1 Tax=Paracoccus aminophilus JCM 7686 TaxID=1367847 RepID=S5XVZ9_PARAH|nr:hypothetical protein [Paracoccus aminophilus]AGT09467.1 hypothetical protein JCM7686_2399 [Paracoccus aminophilus JCM 7686]
MKIEIPEGCTAPEAYADSFAEAYAEGVQLERTRILTILGSDEAKDRPELARKLALETDLPAEAAAAFMADMPVEEAATDLYSYTGLDARAREKWARDIAKVREVHKELGGSGAHSRLKLDPTYRAR